MLALLTAFAEAGHADQDAAVPEPRKDSQEAPSYGSWGPYSHDPVELDPITVIGQREYFLPGDEALAAIRRSLECAGCAVVDHTELPTAARIALAITGAAVRMFTEQPRVRGDPNDEALYYALRRCWPDRDRGGCADRHPITALYNWAPDRHQGFDDEPSRFTSR